MDLSADEIARYNWQLPIEDLGVEGQKKLRQASVLVTRVGGVGGAAATYLAMAGVGRLVLAHAGSLKPSDLNRQTLMSTGGVGKLRVTQAAERLRELNPLVVVEAVAENVEEGNAARLVGKADLVVDAAPVFKERFLLNREAVRLRKPMVDCAMYEMELQVTTVVPGQGPCLACLTPEDPPAWKRQFPVLGAVAGLAGTIGAVEATKVLTGLGRPLVGELLLADLRAMSFRTVRVERNASCAVCAGV
jgi:molybdopterin/thiamine biosynthesis adenylyltransferase